MEIVYSGVRAELARRDISQVELARRLGVHYNTVNNWLKGGRNPELGSVLGALRVIGMTDEQILDMRIRDLISIVDEKTPAE